MEKNLPPLRAVVVRVPLVLSSIVLVIEILHILVGVTLGLDSVVLVESLGFNELVDFGTDEADESLFGEGVGDWLSYTIVSNCSSKASWVDGRERVTGDRGDIPSARRWSSKALKASKLAAPAISSWESLPSWGWPP